MKETKNGIKAALVFAALLATALAVSAAPGVGSQNFGITNAFLGPGLGATALGVTTQYIPYNDYITLSFKATVANTNEVAGVSTVRAEFAWVDVDGNVDVTTQGRLIWVIPVPLITGALATQIATNTAFAATTNITRDIVGARYGLSMLSLTNVNTAVVGGQMLSPVMKINIKNRISP